ncbi:MAG TPA: glycosyltransferase family 61 protein, partial [Acidiphilium sp.]
MLRNTETLHPGRQSGLPASVVYTNATLLGLDAFARSMSQGIYAARNVTFEPILLGALPQGCRLLGGDSFWVETDDSLAADQINPLTADIPAIRDQLAALPFDEERIGSPCLLVARYGEITWGHWVGEILPRAILAEEAWPGRFRYVVSEAITRPGENRDYATAILETLAAYGIHEDRLLRLRPDRHYRFDHLHAITGIWSPHGMNPDAMRVMRESLKAPEQRGSAGRLAILRRDAATRGIFNQSEIESLLTARGFIIVDPVRLPFIDQIALFRDAEMIFGVLGSGLIGLIYAPEAMRVVTAAPGDWADPYFHMLIKARNGWQADLRGSTLWTGSGLPRDAPFLLDPNHTETALDLLEKPEAELAPDGIIALDDIYLSRHPGRTVLSVDFAAGGNAQSHIRDGWSVQEDNHVWSIGPHSTMHLSAPHGAGRYVLELDVLALTMPEFVVARPLTIIINGTPAGAFSIAGFAHITCLLPPTG